MILNMNIEIKIFINTDKKLHGNSNIDDSAKQRDHQCQFQDICLDKLSPLDWNQSNAIVKSLCREVWIVIGFNPRRKSWVSSAYELILE